MDISRVLDLDPKRILRRMTLPGVDLNIPAVTIFLMAFGAIMIYSASSYESMIENGDPAYYANKQILHVIIAIIAMYVVALMDYRFFVKISPWLTGFCLGLVALTRIPPFAYVVNGAHRWVRVAGKTVQPSEVVKIHVILFTTWLLCRMVENNRLDRQYISTRGRSALKKEIIGLINKLIGTAIILGLCLFYAVLLWKVTDNMSSAIIVCGIGVSLMFIVSKSYKWYVIFGSVGALGVAGLVYSLKTGLISPSGSFRLARIKTWLDPAADAKGYGFQTLQSLYSIGSGGVWGKGLGNSIQKMGIIPEAQNDMIFSIICEELGIFGGIVVMCLFLFLLYRLFLAAQNAPDLAGSLITVGVLSHVALQVIINIAVVTNLMPNTGVTMPFISYGGTSIIFLGAEMGLVLSVSGRTVLE